MRPSTFKRIARHAAKLHKQSPKHGQKAWSELSEEVRDSFMRRAREERLSSKRKHAQAPSRPQQQQRSQHTSFERGRRVEPVSPERRAARQRAQEEFNKLTPDEKRARRAGRPVDPLEARAQASPRQRRSSMRDQYRERRRRPQPQPQPEKPTGFSAFEERAQARGSRMASRSRFSGQPFNALFPAAIGTAALWALGNYTADASGQFFFGEREEGYSLMSVAREGIGRQLIGGPLGEIRTEASAGVYASITIGALAGLGVGEWAFKHAMGSEAVKPGDLPFPEASPINYDADRPMTQRVRDGARSLRRDTAPLERGAGIGENLRRTNENLKLFGKKGMNSLARRSGAMATAGMVGVSMATTFMTLRTGERMAQAVIANAPVRSPGHEVRARTRQSTATGSRVARQSGDFSGVGATGDLVHALHRTGGQGMVIR